MRTKVTVNVLMLARLPVNVRQSNNLNNRYFQIASQNCLMWALLYVCCLPGDSSIYTDELRAILLALKHIYHSKEKPFLVLPDSLSALQAIHNLKYDHPILIKIHELYS